MARSGNSFIELVTFSKLLKERHSSLKDDVNKEGHSTRKIQKVLGGTVFQKYIIRTGNHGMIRPERRQILALISKWKARIVLHSHRAAWCCVHRDCRTESRASSGLCGRKEKGSRNRISVVQVREGTAWTGNWQKAQPKAVGKMASWEHVQLGAFRTRSLMRFRRCKTRPSSL